MSWGEDEQGWRRRVNKGEQEEYNSLDCAQSLSFVLVIERLERARCAIARETAARSSRPSSPFSARLCLSLASVPQLLWMGKERDCAQSNTPRTEGAHR